MNTHIYGVYFSKNEEKQQQQQKIKQTRPIWWTNGHPYPYMSTHHYILLYCSLIRTHTHTCSHLENTFHLRFTHKNIYYSWIKNEVCCKWFCIRYYTQKKRNNNIYISFTQSHFKIYYLNWKKKREKKKRE